MSSLIAPSFTHPRKTACATTNLTVENKDMKPLFDTILDYIPAPEGDPDAGTAAVDQHH